MTENLPRGILYSKDIRPAAIHPELGQRLQHRKEPQKHQETAEEEDQKGTPFRFPHFRKRSQVQGHFSAKTIHCKDRPQLSQPPQPSILNTKPCKCSECKGSVPTGLPLKKDIAKSDEHNTIKNDLGLGAQKAPGTSRSSPEKVLRPRKPALRTEKVPYMKPAEHYSLLEAKTKRKPATTITELPVKPRRPYMHTLEARDLTPPGVPASNLPQAEYPSSPICEADYSKAARDLEILYHDPGGTRMESASASRFERGECIYSTAEAQKTQRAPPPAASHGATKSHPDALPRYISVLRPASYFQAANPQQIRTLRGIGKGSVKPSTNPKMAKHAPQKSCQEVDSGHHPWCVTMEGPGERVRPSAAKQRTVEVKEEPPRAWRVSLGSRESQNSQLSNISARVFGSLGVNRLPDHLQIPPSQHSQDSCSNIFISNKQPRGWPVSHYPVGPSRVHSAEYSLPSQDSLPSLHSTGQNTKTSQGLCDVFRKRHHRVDTKENRVGTDKNKV